MPIVESSLPIIVAAAVGMLSAILAALMPDPVTVQSLGLMDDSRLRLICIAGSLAGAVVSVVLFEVSTHKELARKLTCSALSGVIFTPILIQYFGWPSGTDYVLGISACTALLSWSLLLSVLPQLLTWLSAWGGSKLKLPPPQN